MGVFCLYFMFVILPAFEANCDGNFCPDTAPINGRSLPEWRAALCEEK